MRTWLNSCNLSHPPPSPFRLLGPGFNNVLKSQDSVGVTCDPGNCNSAHSFLSCLIFQRPLRQFIPRMVTEHPLGARWCWLLATWSRGGVLGRLGLAWDCEGLRWEPCLGATGRVGGREGRDHTCMAHHRADSYQEPSIPQTVQVQGWSGEWREGGLGAPSCGRDRKQGNGPPQ